MAWTPRFQLVGRVTPRRWSSQKYLPDIGITAKRFKTGTPPRIDGRSVDFARLERQDGDPADYWFSFLRAGRASRPASVLPHVDRRLPSGDHPAAPSRVGVVRRSDQRSRAEVLPIDRGQDRQVPGGSAPPGLPRARGPRHDRDVCQRSLDVASAGRAARVSANGARAGAGADDSAGIRDRVRLLPADPAQSRPWNRGHFRVSSSPAR